MLGPVSLLGAVSLGWVALRPHAVAAAGGIAKIKHIIIITQENRSFDDYFGTFPGADGIPMDSQGVPTVCVPDPASGGCQSPYVDHHDHNGGGPHGAAAAKADIDGGKMDGFIGQAEQGSSAASCLDEFNPLCVQGPIDVMGYHTQSDIPNYWQYAQDFVLQDHFFEATASWSLPEHLFQVSGWSGVDPRSWTRVVVSYAAVAGS